MGCSVLTSWSGYVGDGDDASPDSKGPGADSNPGTDTGVPNEASGQGDDAMTTDDAGTDATGKDGSIADARANETGVNDGSTPVVDAAPETGGNPGNDASTGAITFIQAAGTNASNVTSTSATFASAQNAGDLIVLAIGWAGTATLTQLYDSSGNSYQQPPFSPTHDKTATQAIYYSSGIKAAAAGANVVTVTFSPTGLPSSMDLVVAEYAGLDPVSPYDTGTGWDGAGSAASTSYSVTPVTTSTPHELIVGAGFTLGSFSGAGSAFTPRKLTAGGVGLLEDRVVSSTGTYSADAALFSSNSYVMSIATFR
jgi:hypothetical protein